MLARSANTAAASSSSSSSAVNPHAFFSRQAEATTPEYKQLTCETIPAFLAGLNKPQLRSFTQAQKLQVTEIGTGNLNHVFRLINTETQESIIVKQALPYCRVLGPDYLLAKERMRFEIMYAEFAASISPQHIPKLLHTDGQVHMVMVMQDLNDLKDLRLSLMASNSHEKLSTHIGPFLAEILFKTSRFYLNFEKHAALVGQFNDNRLCTLTEDFLFTFPHQVHATNQRSIDFSPEFKFKALRLRYCFATQREALIHADLHTSSMMADAKSTYVIDSEFAIMGPIGFDLGFILANLITAWVAHLVQDSNPEYCNFLYKTIEDLVVQFNSKFIALWNEYDVFINPIYLTPGEKKVFQMDHMSGIFSSAMGFAGIEICRRVCGIAHAKELFTITNPEMKIRAEALALHLGQTFVEKHEQMRDLSNLLSLLNNCKTSFQSPEPIVSSSTNKPSF